MSRFALLIALFLASTLINAAGSPEAGKQKSLTCSACHGADGNSLNPEWPSLAGQHPRYSIRQMQAYQSGERQNVLMSGMAMGLSEQDIEDLAAYFAAQPAVLRTADPALVPLGQQIYRGGITERGVPACSACHGPKGIGNILAGYPIIRGQHATYTAATLRAYKSGERKTDSSYSQMMRNIASGLTDDEIIALAGYIQGLR